jgi:hypothetical protein
MFGRRGGLGGALPRFAALAATSAFLVSNLALHRGDRHLDICQRLLRANAAASEHGAALLEQIDGRVRI